MTDAYIKINFQTCFLCAGQILFGGFVLIEHTFGITPIADADKCEIHSGVLYLFPVDLLLMLGYIHTQPGLSGGAGQIIALVFKIIRGVGVSRQGSCDFAAG